MKPSGAIFSECRTWRYFLWRRWDMALPVLICVLLNPSVAGEVENDHTVTKLIQFAHNWGFGGLDLYNIFAACSTDPKALYQTENPIGPDNNRWLLTIPSGASVVCAWGRHGEYRERGASVKRVFLVRDCELKCFGKCSNGEPTHPLYLPYSTELRTWQ
jgi:hypothetical protein